LVSIKTLLKVEEKINIRCRSNNFKIAEGYTNLQNAIDSRINSRRAIDFVEERLIKTGYVKKNGMPDFARFYKYACINSDVWSTFSTGSHVPSKETLLKIIIGLRLNEVEAKEFLMLAGSGFNHSDYRDIVILACIDCGYYEIEDVYDILEKYGSMMVCGKRRFTNIY
jgi:hypothetical protein